MVSLICFLPRREGLTPQDADRMLLLCDSASDTASLPTTDGLTLPDGRKTRRPDTGSYAIIRGGNPLTFGGDGTWAAM